MTSFVVMAPPDFESLAGTPEQTDRIAFVPDKFSVLAVIFSIPWMLVHRMWLVLLGYLALTLVIEVLALSLGGVAMGVAASTVAVLFGFEAQALRRWSLSRKGWRVLSVIEAAHPEDAEIRFFHGQADRETPEKQQDTRRPQAPRTPIIPRIGSEQVVGLTLGPETRQ